MAKRKIKGDGENNKQEKFGLNHGITEVGKASKIIRSNLQQNPTTATEPPKATCAQFLDGDCHLPGQSLPKPDHTFHEKNFPNIWDNSTSLLPNKLCHPCPGLERRRSTTGTVNWGWEKLRAKTHKISALSMWRMECVGLRPFPKCPKCPEVPQQLRMGICQWDISGEQRHQCPNIYRNTGAPGLPAHLQESHSKSHLKCHFP